MARSPEKITLPYLFEPREYQIPGMRFILERRGNRSFKCWHRRGGKDITDWNTTICAAVQEVGLYLYTLPTYAQGRKAIWDAIDKHGRKFRDFIPQSLVKSTRDNDMRLELVNGSIIQVVGTDEIDRIMGTNPRGVVFSEFSLQKPTAWEYISPILRENGGWAIFNGTMRPPAESPHFCAMLDMALESPEWFAENLSIEDTKAIKVEDVEREVSLGIITQQLARQEYYNDRYASSENILIKQENILAAFERDMPYAYEPCVAGIDVGHSLGGDPSAIVIRRGGKIVYIGEERIDNLKEVAGWAAKAMLFHDCKHATADGIGWGAGISALMLNEYSDLDVREVNVSENPSFKGMFSRRRDELWYKMGRAFEEDKMDIPNTKLGKKLGNELSGVTYKFLPTTNKIKVMSKEEMKSNGKKSPNLADALMLSFDWGDVLNAHMQRSEHQRKAFLAA